MQGLLSNQGQAAQQENPDQQQTDEFVLNGMDILHNPATRGWVVEVLKSGGDPTDAVAGLAWTTLEQIEQSAAKSGLELSENAKVNGGNELVGEIIQIGEKAGAFPQMSEEERALSYQKVVAKYLDREVAAGRIDPRELQQVGQQAAQKKGLDLAGAHSKLMGLGGQR